MTTATRPTTAELSERSTEPMVRARWARRCEAGGVPAAVRTSGARPSSRDTRELVAPSTTRWIARWMRNRATSASTRISAIEVLAATIASADRARKSLLVHE
jgi:hypothetical protein